MSSRLTTTVEEQQLKFKWKKNQNQKKNLEINKQTNNKQQEMLTKLVALRMKDTTVLITIRQDDLTVARA